MMVMLFEELGIKIMPVHKLLNNSYLNLCFLIDISHFEKECINEKLRNLQYHRFTFYRIDRLRIVAIFAPYYFEYSLP